MAEIGRLFVTIGSTLDSKGFKEAANQIKNIGIVAGVMGAAVVAAGLKVAKAAGDQEQAELTLAAAMKQAGTYTDQAIKHSIEYASTLQKLTVYSDEAIISTQKMLTNFGIEGKMLDKLTQATLDLAAAKGMDLTSAADLVAKAVGSSTNALARYGIIVNGAVGSTERAQTAVDNISKLFGGSAKAQAETYLGRIAKLSNQWSDFQERIGVLVIPILERLMANVSRFIQIADKWISENKDLVATIVALAAAFAALATGLSPLMIILPTFIMLLRNTMVATSALWAVMAAHPLIIITAAFAGLTLAITAYLDKAIKTKEAHLEMGNTTRSLIEIQKREMETQKMLATSGKLNEEERINALRRYEMLRKNVARLEDQLTREEQRNQNAVTRSTIQNINARKEYTTQWIDKKRMMDQAYIDWQREQDAIRFQEWILDSQLKLETASLFFTQLTATAQAFATLQTTRIQNETNESIDAENTKYNDRRAWILQNITDETQRTEMLNALDEAHAARVENIRQEGERKQSEARKRLKPYMIAEAIANTALAAIKSMANFGWPVGAIMAALALAAGYAQIATIKAQQFAAGGMAMNETLGILGEGGAEVALPLTHPNTIDALSMALRGAIAASGIDTGAMNLYVTVPAITSRAVAREYGDIIGDQIVQKVKRNRRI